MLQLLKWALSMFFSIVRAESRILTINEKDCYPSCPSRYIHMIVTWKLGPFVEMKKKDYPPYRPSI